MRCALAVLLAACGDNLAAPDVAMFPAFAVQMPKVLTQFGPVMASTRVVPIFYPSDPLRADLLAALDRLAASPVWSGGIAEYGVGALSIAPPVDLAPAPMSAISEHDVRDLVLSQWGTEDVETLATTIYVVFEPATTTLTGNFGTSCVDYGAFHFATPPGGPRITYAVLPRCPNRSTLDTLFPVVTHELFEAAANPLLTAWNGVREDDFAWVLATHGSEIADLCSYLPDDYAPFDVGTPVSRVWSNQNAVAFHDPCRPIPDGQGPFFAAIPDAPATVTQDLGGGRVTMMLGNKVALGGTITIPLRLASDGPTGAWELTAVDRDPDPAPLGFAFDRMSGHNGDVVNLDVTAHARPFGGIATFIVISTLDGRHTMWPAAVEVTP